MDRKVLSAIFKETVNGYGIIRCEEKKTLPDGKLVGQLTVWYDVCLDGGEGDIVESFKTLRDARRYAKNN